MPTKRMHYTNLRATLFVIAKKEKWQRKQINKNGKQAKHPKVNLWTNCGIFIPCNIPQLWKGTIPHMLMSNCSPKWMYQFVSLPALHESLQCFIQLPLLEFLDVCQSDGYNT